MILIFSHYIYSSRKVQIFFCSVKYCIIHLACTIRQKSRKLVLTCLSDIQIKFYMGISGKVIIMP